MQLFHSHHLQFHGHGIFQIHPSLPLQVPLPGRPRSYVTPSAFYFTQYPYTGSAVLLALLPETGYTPEVLIVGGQNVLANTNLNLSACSESLRLTIALPDEATGASYTFGSGWVTEVMGGPRVMPDATILVSGGLPHS